MRRRVVEEQVNHERWLVSYADFITLLFAFFVVMYSISQVSESKYRVLSDTLTDAFSNNSGNPLPQKTLDPFQVGKPSLSQTINPIDLGAMALKNSEGEAEGEGGGDEKGELPEQFKKITDQVEEVFGDLVKTKMIHLRGNEEWLAVEMSSSLLFDSGMAELNAGAMELLGSLVNLLGDAENPIRVEGFTDNVPISNASFASNWELSAARASAVVKLFIEEGVAPKRLAAVGYGEHQPIAANDTPEGRNKNRRVVLMISKTGELRPELPEIAQSADYQTPDAELPSEIAEPDKLPLDGVKRVELEGGGLLFTSEE